MSKRRKYLFYGLLFAWCVWLVAMSWYNVDDDPTWYNISSLIIASLLLLYWLWSIYRVAKPKVRQLDFIVEGKDDGFWVTFNGKTEAGPFAYRREAFDHIINIVKETK